MTQYHSFIDSMEVIYEKLKETCDIVLCIFVQYFVLEAIPNITFSHNCILLYLLYFYDVIKGEIDSFELERPALMTKNKNPIVRHLSSFYA